jgi:hypothetical protein
LKPCSAERGNENQISSPRILVQLHEKVKAFFQENSSVFTVVAYNQESIVDHVDDNHSLIPRNVLGLVSVEKFPKINSWHVVFPHLLANKQRIQREKIENRNLKMYSNNNVKVFEQYLEIVLTKLGLFFYTYRYDELVDYRHIVVRECHPNVQIIV